jgi:hypothetical protein
MEVDGKAVEFTNLFFDVYPGYEPDEAGRVSFSASKRNKLDNKVIETTSLNFSSAKAVARALKEAVLNGG